MSDFFARQMSKHLESVYFGGNWTSVCFEDVFSQLNLENINHSVKGSATTLTLIYHAHYFVVEVNKVLEGAPLTARDKYSFSPPEISTSEDLSRFIEQIREEAIAFAKNIASRDDDFLASDFIDPQYGTWHKNLMGIIEHLHYHLGQIRMILR